MKNPKTIRDYIKNEPTHIQKNMKHLYAIVKKAAPKASEKLAWGMPTLHQEGNLLHFAAFKNHMTLFVGTEVMDHFQSQLKRFSTTKAGVHFSYDKPLPTPLITKITKYCVKNNLAYAKAKALKKAKKKKTKR